MQLLQTRRSIGHADINRRSGGNKRLHVAQGHFERLSLAADSRKHLQGGAFGPAQQPWRQKGNVGSEMRQVGMQLPPEVLHELSHRTSHIRYQRIPRALHIQQKIIALSVVYNRNSCAARSLSFVMSGRSAAW